MTWTSTTNVKNRKLEIIVNETGVSFDGEQNTMVDFWGPQVKKRTPPNKLFVWEAIKWMFIIVLGIELFIQQLSQNRRGKMMGTERFEVSRHTESTSAKAHPQHYNTSCLRNYREANFNL